MTNQVIPEVAVEAAAVASAAAFGETPNKRDFEHIRLVLEAAAPHMLAGAWEEGASAQARCYGMDKDTGPNPYRSKP